MEEEVTALEMRKPARILVVFYRLLEYTVGRATMLIMPSLICGFYHIICEIIIHLRINKWCMG